MELFMLYQLQQLEEAIQDINHQRLESDEYRQLVEIKADFTRKKEHYAQLLQQLAAVEQQTVRLPELLAAAKQRVVDEQHAIYDGTVTSQKVLSARETQLTSLQEKLGQMQDQQQNLAAQRDEISEEATALRAELEQIKQRFEQLKTDYATAQDGRDQQQAELEQRRQQLLPDIPPADFSWFEAQKAKFSGGPVACLDAQQVCSGCYTTVPQIMYKRAGLGQVTNCEKCGRRLFIYSSEG